MGLKLANGKPPGDTDKIGDLKLKQGQKIMMLGSQEEAITAFELYGDDADVADFEIEDDVLKELAPHEDPDVLVCCTTSRSMQPRGKQILAQYVRGI